MLGLDRPKATARAGVKLWLGAKPNNAGVFSAGNGPAMRAAIFGAAIDDVPEMLEFVRSSTRLTHTDPKAEYGAIAVAFAAGHSRDHEAVDANLWLSDVVDAVGGDGSEMTHLLRRSVESVVGGESTKSFGDSLGLSQGVSGYTYHTVPVAIHAWLSHPNDFRQAVTAIKQSKLPPSERYARHTRLPPHDRSHPRCCVGHATIASVARFIQLLLATPPNESH